MSDRAREPFAFSLPDGTTLLALHDGVFAVQRDELVDMRGADATEAFRAAHPDGFTIDVQCFALRRDEGVVLIDVGTGRAWGDRLGHAAEALQAAGVAPDAVTHVLLTHLHGDHALGLFDDAGGRRYPNATVHAPRADLAAPGDDEAVRRVLDGFGAAMRGIDEGEVLPGIEAVTLPGHTVGHTGYLIGSLVLISGDVLQVDDAQGAAPSLSLVFDADGTRAEQTRRDLLATAADRSWTVASSHLPFPGLVQIDRDGAGFRFIDAGT